MNDKHKIYLKCLECDKKFNRILSPNSGDILCPKCKSNDIDLDILDIDKE